jgi:hypothetical protein
MECIFKKCGEFTMLHKLIAAFLLAATFSGTAFAAGVAHWQLWGDKGNGKLYFDLNSLERVGNIVTVQEKEEKTQADAKGIKSEILGRQYDVKKSQCRTFTRQLYNAKGKMMVTNKKVESWQKIAPQSTQAAQMEYLLAASRIQGPWNQVKNIGNVAVKFYNPSTLKETKKDVLEVWEKLELNKVEKQTKSIVSLVRYDVAKGTATTLYTCEFNARKELLSAKADIDNWGVKDDTYGEYIGNELKQKLHKK